jgi:transposase-like protein
MTIERRWTFTPEFKLEAAQLVVEQNYSIREAANAKRKSGHPHLLNRKPCAEHGRKKDFNR